MTFPVQFTSKIFSEFVWIMLYDLLKRDKRISVGTTKTWCLCEFLREAMKRFLREHRTGDIFEFITSTVIQSRFILVCQQMYIFPIILLYSFFFFGLVDVNPRFRTKLCLAVKYITKIIWSLLDFVHRAAPTDYDQLFSTVV